MAKTSSGSPARLAAFEILLRVEEGAYASVLLANREEQLQPADRRLTHELVLGVLRNQLWLDRLAEHYTNRKSNQLDPEIRIALRLGLYQLRYLSRIPTSAAVNESVNLALTARKRSAGGLINAVLRRAAVESNFNPLDNIEDPVERIAVETSHPAWLVERWIRQFGPAEAHAFARANNEPAPVAFRVVHNRANKKAVLDSLRDGGADLSPSSVAKGAWRVKGGGRALTELTATGKVYVQDEASQLLSLLVDPQPGERILDVCAAPGSKTTHLADLSGDSATIIAADVHEHRLKTVASSVKLQGFNNIKCVVLDGLRDLPVVEGRFDRVLVDAPCSGTGTLRRNPEIRWRISTGDIQDLAARQTQLLINASKTVKLGGRLVYSTCSVETEENEDVRQVFLDNCKNFQPLPLALDASLLTNIGAGRTWPQRQGTDGFFICAFERVTA